MDLYEKRTNRLLLLSVWFFGFHTAGLVTFLSSIYLFFFPRIYSLIIFNFILLVLLTAAYRKHATQRPHYKRWTLSVAWLITFFHSSQIANLFNPDNWVFEALSEYFDITLAIFTILLFVVIWRVTKTVTPKNKNLSLVITAFILIFTISNIATSFHNSSNTSQYKENSSNNSSKQIDSAEILENFQTISLPANVPNANTLQRDSNQHSLVYVQDDQIIKYDTYAKQNEIYVSDNAKYYVRLVDHILEIGTTYDQAVITTITIKDTLDAPSVLTIKDDLSELVLSGLYNSKTKRYYLINLKDGSVKDINWMSYFNHIYDPDYPVIVWDDQGMHLYISESVGSKLYQDKIIQTDEEGRHLTETTLKEPHNISKNESYAYINGKKPRIRLIDNVYFFVENITGTSKERLVAVPVGGTYNDATVLSSSEGKAHYNLVHIKDQNLVAVMENEDAPLQLIYYDHATNSTRSETLTSDQIDANVNEYIGTDQVFGNLYFQHVSFPISVDGERNVEKSQVTDVTYYNAFTKEIKRYSETKILK